jgi:hypothetical protein
MRTAWLTILLAAGCFAPDFKSGRFECSSDGKCPPGFRCAADNRCYGAGQLPDLATLVAESDDLATEFPDAGTADLSQGAADAAIRDGANPDIAAVPLIFPPAAVFISGGGGSGAATSGVKGNISLGSWSTPGLVAASGGATVTFGYFAEETVP